VRGVQLSPESIQSEIKTPHQVQHLIKSSFLIGITTAGWARVKGISIF